MVTWNCDKCEHPLEAEAAHAGAKVECPHCGDVNIIPTPGAGRVVPGGVTPAVPKAAPASRAAGRATAMGLPPESGTEQRVALVRPATFRSKPLRYLGMLVMIIGGGVGAAVFALSNPPNYTLAIICGVVGVAGLVIWLVWKVSTMSETLEITTKRVTLTRGLLSKDLSEIPHEDIQNIQIKQSFFDRLMGIGQLGVSSAGQDDVEIVISGIPRPYQVREMIDAYRGVMD